jgi:hypothetical protein
MLDIRRLPWEPEVNEAHIRDKHGPTRQQVEEVCAGDVLVQEGYGGRVVLVGPTRAGRMLEVVLEPEGNGEYYVVTAHPASRKDRALYRRETGIER